MVELSAPAVLQPRVTPREEDSRASPPQVSQQQPWITPSWLRSPQAAGALQ